ncbi:unnamed protein product [Oikopleura dioica]|uniref:Uncharacterized protein n=1 Tax=Oikopleura dioica TaxID=34765 RepID=E4YP41_OIKDI|nr:unnamed protein product [Oikopleura dioica]
MKRLFDTHLRQCNGLNLEFEIKFPYMRNENVNELRDHVKGLANCNFGIDSLVCCTQLDVDLGSAGVITLTQERNIECVKYISRNGEYSLRYYDSSGWLLEQWTAGQMWAPVQMWSLDVPKYKQEQCCPIDNDAGNAVFNLQGQAAPYGVKATVVAECNVQRNRQEDATYCLPDM